MMRTRVYTILFASGLAAAALPGCKKWDTHNAITEEALNKTLFEQISADTSLSRFTQYLTKTGYDKVISSSKTFTVYAPSNAAIASLDAGIVNDTAKLRLFVGNHIATQSYFTTTAADTMRIPMVNGKYHNILNSTIEDATISRGDNRAKNGVYHVINKMLPALDNCWDALSNNAAIPAAQKTFMLSLFMKVYDLTNAVQIGVNDTSGAPIYQPGTDSIMTNLFWRYAYDLRDESQQFTLFVLVDSAWNTETIRYSPYFKYTDSLSTAKLAKWNVVKDFGFAGAYTPATLPDTLHSRSGVSVPVDKSAIVQTITTSNGIIYVMKKVAITPPAKLRSFVIQGENYNTYSVDKRSVTYFRDRYNPLTNLDFRDVLVYNHGVASFNLGYKVSGLYSMTYKAYWVALNDFQTTSFTQKLALADPTTSVLPYVTVSPNVYSEVYLGSFTLSQYQDLMMLYLVAAANTTAATDPLVCDYIRLEPQF